MAEFLEKGGLLKRLLQQCMGVQDGKLASRCGRTTRIGDDIKQPALCTWVITPEIHRNVRTTSTRKEASEHLTYLFRLTLETVNFEWSYFKFGVLVTLRWICTIICYVVWQMSLQNVHVVRFMFAFVTLKMFRGLAFLDTLYMHVYS